MLEIIAGLTILAKYGTHRDNIIAEHQYIYINVEYSEISAEDQDTLSRLGFTESPNGTVWVYT